MLSYLRPRGFRYSPLDQAPEGSKPSSNTNTNEGSLAGPNALTRYAIWIIAICAVVDAAAFAYLSVFFKSHQMEPPTSLNDISLRSTYVGLDELYIQKGFESIPRGPVINLPILATQVDASDPSQVIPPWRELRLTARASVQINDRRFLVTPQISTIVQFHAVDYGMENCTVLLIIPPFLDEDTQSPATQTPRRVNNGSVIDIWELNAAHLLDLRSLSWETKPSRRRHVGAFTLSYGTTQELPGFYCKSASPMAFEMACAPDSDEACLLETYSDKYEAIGLYIQQYQTV